jgi:hypothetical protein
MRHKLRTAEGQSVYRLRRAVVGPVFGQIKEAHGYRRFLLRGRENAQAGQQMICATHNRLKLFAAPRMPETADPTDPAPPLDSLVSAYRLAPASRKTRVGKK